MNEEVQDDFLYMPMYEAKTLLLGCLSKIENPQKDENGEEIPFSNEEKKAIKFCLSSNLIFDTNGSQYISMLDNIPEGMTDHETYKMVLMLTIRDGLNKDLATRFGI